MTTAEARAIAKAARKKPGACPPVLFRLYQGPRGDYMGRTTDVAVARAHWEAREREPDRLFNVIAMTADREWIMWDRDWAQITEALAAKPGKPTLEATP